MREHDEEQRLVTLSFLDELYEEVRQARRREADLVAEVERLRLVLLAKLDAELELLELARRGTCTS